MTLPIYALPFASTKGVSPVVNRVGDTKPMVVIQFVDGEGEPQDSGSALTTLKLYDAMSAETEITGEWDVDTLSWYFPWPDPTTEAEYHTEVLIEDGTDSLHYPAPQVFVYDPANLWADPATVIALAGGGYSTSEAVVAILVASEAVRAWATRPVASPVPDAVRGAVAVLAARVLTSPPPGEGGDPRPIISERIGDYQVRYADEAGVLAISGSLASSLAFLHPTTYDTDVGPVGHDAHSVSSSLPMIEAVEVIVP